MFYLKINLLHIFLIGPLISYIGFRGAKTDKIAYGVLLGLAFIIPFIVKTPEFIVDYRNIIRWIHYCLWPILFVYIGYKQMDLHPVEFEILKYFGILICIIHMYLLYKNFYSDSSITLKGKN
jgi:hypothetical protein